MNAGWSGGPPYDGTQWAETARFTFPINLNPTPTPRTTPACTQVRWTPRPPPAFQLLSLPNKREESRSSPRSFAVPIAFPSNAISPDRGFVFHKAGVSSHPPKKKKGSTEVLPRVSPFKLNMLTARYLFCLRPERRPERAHPLRVKVGGAIVRPTLSRKVGPRPTLFS